ncbi:MAG: type II toxin-antitoxin system PemK/MazF family toxin [Thermoplasmatota archaeon]
MTLDAGDIVLLPFPHTDLKSGKKRPALVLTDAAYHGDSLDVVLAYVTSQPQKGPWVLPVTSKDLSSGGLVKESWVRVDRLATVEQRLVQRVAGRLAPAKMDDVKARIVRLLG